MAIENYVQNGILPVRDVVSSRDKIDWLDIERQVVESGKSDSLPRYLQAQHHDEFRSVKDIAKELGISRNGIKGIMAKVGIHCRTRSERYDLVVKADSEGLQYGEFRTVEEVVKRSHHNVDWLGIERQLIESGEAGSLPEFVNGQYHDHGKSAVEIAGMLGVSDTSLYVMMGKLGIDIKTISEAKLGDLNPNFGNTYTDERKRNMSERNSGENNPFYGRSHSEETKEILANHRIGKTIPEATRRKISLATSGIKHFNYGKPHSETTKLRISQAHLSLWDNPKWVKNRLADRNRSPNKCEQRLIHAIQDENIFSETQELALPGEVYFPELNGDIFVVKFIDDSGKVFRYKYPDFVVKGQPRVVEVYGDYWHSEDFKKPRGAPEFDWDPELLVQEYAEAGIEAKVFWEHEINDPQRLNEIVFEIKDWIRTPMIAA